MKLIIQIASAEIKKLFYAPIIWILLGFFMILVAYYHTFNFIRFAEWQEKSESGEWSALTFRMFSTMGAFGLFRILLASSFLFVPLVSMSVFSTDYDRGSFRLLQTSPARASQIALGKYGALLFYAFLLCTILLGLTFICSWYIPHYDFQYIFPGVIGFFLLTSGFLAIGLFISSLTSSTVIAGAITFSVLGILNILGEVGQNIPVVKNILYWIAFSDRTAQMMQGLISSKNVIYFLIVSIFFVVLTIFRLHAFSHPLFSRLNTIRVVLLIGVTILVAWLSIDPYYVFYKDFTRGGSQTITTETQEIAGRLTERPLILNTYVNLLNGFTTKSYLPANSNNDKARFEKYIRFLPNWEFRYYYYYDTLPDNQLLYNQNKGLSTRQIAYKLADVYGIDREALLSADEMKQLTDLSTEPGGYVREFIYGQHRAFLPMFNDVAHYPKEREVKASLKQLADGPITVGMVTGHGERTVANTDENYYLLLAAREDNRNSLRNAGFLTVPVNLDSTGILDEVDMLIIADPEIPYSPLEVKTVEEYIEGGGNVIIAAEPANRTIVNPLLEIVGLKQYAVGLRPKNHEYGKKLVIADIDSAFYQGEFYKYYKKRYRFSTLSPVGFLQSPGYISVIDTGQFSTNAFLSVKTHSIFISGSDKQPNESTKKVLAYGLERQVNNKHQKILVIADADFLSNKQYTRYVPGINNNQLFLWPLFDWLSGNSKPVITFKDQDSQLHLSISQAKHFKIFLLYLLPAFLLCLGAVFLMIRKRR